MNALLTSFVPIALGLWVGYKVATDQRTPFTGLASGARVAIFFVVAFCAADLLRGIFGIFGSLGRDQQRQPVASAAGDRPGRDGLPPVHAGRRRASVERGAFGLNCRAIHSAAVNSFTAGASRAGLACLV